jgi:hypothetical protein
MTVHRNVPLLAGAQALYWCGQVIAIIVAALVGQMLAPHRLLATLPLACITLGNIAVTRTLSRIMQERGLPTAWTPPVEVGPCPWCWPAASWPRS